MDYRASDHGLLTTPSLASAQHNDAVLGELFRLATLVGGVVLLDTPFIPIHNLKLNPDPAGRKRADLRGVGPGVALVRVGASDAAIEIGTNGVGLHNSRFSGFEIHHHTPDAAWGQYQGGVQRYDGVAGTALKLGSFNGVTLERIMTPDHGGGRIAGTAITMDATSSPISLHIQDCVLYAARMNVNIGTAIRAGGMQVRGTRFMGHPLARTLGLCLAPTAVWDTLDLQPGTGFGDLERGIWVMGPTANVKMDNVWFDGIRTHAVYLAGPAASNPNKYQIAGVTMHNCWVRSDGINVEVDPATGIVDTVRIIGGDMGNASGPTVKVGGNLRRFHMHNVLVGNGLQYSGAAIDVLPGARGVSIVGNEVYTTEHAAASIRIDPSIPYPTCQANQVYGKPVLPSYLQALNTTNPSLAD